MAVVQCVVDIPSSAATTGSADLTKASMGLPPSQSTSDWPYSEESAGDGNGTAAGDVWDESAPVAAVGGVGLANLGNTCYQNCVFQCLLNNRHFVSHLMSNGLQLATTTGAEDTIVNEFVTLLKAYRSATCGPIRAEGIRESMSRRHKCLADGRQHDAQEFLALLLDALHEQLMSTGSCGNGGGSGDGSSSSSGGVNGGDSSVANHNHNHIKSNHVTVNANKRLKVSDGPTGADEEALTNNTPTTTCQSSKSCVVDTFQGQLCSLIVCDMCRHTSQTFEAFMYLAVPLPVVRHRQLVVTYQPLNGNGPPTRLLVTVENKYDSVVQIKHKVREQLSLDAIPDAELAVAEVMNGNHVTRVVDDSEDVLSLNDSNSEVSLFQLNQSLNTGADSLDDNDKDCDSICVICLESKPIRSLLSHSICSGRVCEVCLEGCVKHYAKDSVFEPFTCFSCHRDVTKNQFQECQPLAQRELCVPLVFRSDGRLVFGVRLLRVSQQIDANALYALVDQRVPNPEFTYRLVFTERNGIGCCRCAWASDCDGCEVSRAGLILLSEADTLCLALESSLSSSQSLALVPVGPLIGPIAPGLPEALPALEPQPVEHESLKGMVVEEPKPLCLESCLRAFVGKECLTCDGDDNNLWFCQKCDALRSATKSLTIMSSPKTLIVYLKRFLFVANNCHKLSESVSFPIREPLDMSGLVSGAKQPLLYKLSALVCHSGTAQTGHYTAYVRDETNDRWLYFNDDVVTCEEPADNDSRAYILFYSRTDTGALIDGAQPNAERDS